MSKFDGGAGAWLALHQIMEMTEDAMEKQANQLETAAHAWLTWQRKLPRTGMWPKLVDINDEGCRFDVSNGRDYGDDFSVRLTFEQLAEA
jgi:hypothetical protein